MKTRMFGLIIGSGFLIFGAFQNCQQHVAFANQSALKTPSEVKEACETRPRQVKNVAVHFPKPDKTCEWGQNGNLAIREDFFTARIEQTAPIDIPAGATICNMSFSFPTQQYVYDDHFLMTLNGKVLASSFNFDDVLPGSNGLLQYMWSPIAGYDWGGNKAREGVFCTTVIGTDGKEHHSNCSWPATEVPGQISMSFPKEVMYAAMASEATHAQHEFQFISIGDNNEFDCEHSDIKFDVTVDYVQ